MGKEIRKLDKLNQNLNGVFHPNGLEIISNTEVWDIRTFHLLKTVPGLDQCYVKFTNSGDIIYAVALEQETDDGENYESAFKTFDASDYSSIATIETRRGVFDLASSLNDLQIAVVENTLSPQVTEESVVRLYDVGRYRAEEEDVEDGDDDDEDPDAEDEEDDDDIFDGLGLDDDDSLSGSASNEEDDNDDDNNGDLALDSENEGVSSDVDVVDSNAEMTPGNTSDEEYEPGMDDDDQDMEDINFDPESERQTLEILERQLQRQSGDRNSTNSDRTDRRTRRRQHGSSNAVREAAALGAALGRSANSRLRQSGSRLQARRRGRQLQENQENHASPAEDAGDTNNDDQAVSTTESIQPSSSSTTLPSQDRD